MKILLKVNPEKMKKEKVESLEQARAQIDLIDQGIIELIVLRVIFMSIKLCVLSVQCRMFSLQSVLKR